MPVVDATVKVISSIVAYLMKLLKLQHQNVELRFARYLAPVIDLLESGYGFDIIRMDTLTFGAGGTRYYAKNSTGRTIRIRAYTYLPTTGDASDITVEIADPSKSVHFVLNNTVLNAPSAVFLGQDIYLPPDWYISESAGGFAGADVHTPTILGWLV